MTADNTQDSTQALKGCLWFAVPFLVIFGALGLWFGGESEPAPTLSAEHEASVRAALAKQKLPEPDSIEMSGNWLVAKFQMQDEPTEARVRAFAEKALLAIRNDLYGKNVARHYRVTIYGPSPGPGMVNQYGSARLAEGGKVEWKSGVEEFR